MINAIYSVYGNHFWYSRQRICNIFSNCSRLEVQHLNTACILFPITFQVSRTKFFAQKCIFEILHSFTRARNILIPPASYFSIKIKLFFYCFCMQYFFFVCNNIHSFCELIISKFCYISFILIGFDWSPSILATIYKLKVLYCPS